MQNKFGKRMKLAMDIRGIKQVDLAEETGIGKSSISQYLAGHYLPKQTNTYLIARALNVSEAWLMGHDVPMERMQRRAENRSNMLTGYDIPLSGGVPVDDDIGEDAGALVDIPILASVSAGYDGTAVEEVVTEMQSLPRSMLGGRQPDECRILKVKGNSMYPKICDGDKVLVHVQPSVDSGSIAVVIYNGDEATVKKVRYEPGGDWLELIPANPEYETKRLEKAELEMCRVFGKVIMLIRDF